MRFIIDTRVREFMLREPDLDDRWDVGDASGVLEDVFIRRAADWEESERFYSRLERSSYMLPEELCDPGTDLYVVVALVENGCTFGRIGVEAHIMAIETTREAAEETVERLEGETSGRPWHGYFESLEELDVHYLRV